MEKIEKLRNMTSIYLLCEDKMLLLYRQGSRVVNDVWVGSAGGHFEESELNDPEACVLRELEEELSITKDMIVDLELKYITLRRMGELRQNYYFFAKLPNGTGMQLISDEGQLKWFPIEQVSELKMPFSAGFVVEHYLKTGRYDHAVYGGMANGQTVTFVELTDYSR
ncbi:MAG: NUDIX domain-containing protein [Christensenellaceae bacterium]|nr:NUDIX domain-containing protein [Christensenellaceae bacterium]